MKLNSFLKTYRKDQLLEALGRPKKTVDDSGTSHEKAKQLKEVQDITRRLFEPAKGTLPAGPLYGIINYKMDKNILAGKGEDKEDFISKKYGSSDDDEASLEMMGKGLTLTGESLSDKELFDKLNLAIGQLNNKLGENPTPQMKKMGTKEEMVDEFFDKINQNFNAITLLYATHIMGKRNAVRKSEVKIDPNLVYNKKISSGIKIDELFEKLGTPHELRADIKKHVDDIIKKVGVGDPSEQIKEYLDKMANENDVGEPKKYSVSPNRRVGLEDEKNDLEVPKLNRIQNVNIRKDFRMVAGKKRYNLPKELGPEAVNKAIKDDMDKPQDILEKKKAFKAYSALYDEFNKLFPKYKQRTLKKEQPKVEQLRTETKPAAKEAVKETAGDEMTSQQKFIAVNLINMPTGDIKSKFGNRIKYITTSNIAHHVVKSGDGWDFYFDTAHTQKAPFKIYPTKHGVEVK